MRKLIMKMSVSLDGFVCDANGGKDWMFKTGDEESLAWSLERIKEAGLIIMGRKSFQMMAPYWPKADNQFAEPMNTIPKAVFTKAGYKGINTKRKAADLTPAQASWAQARIFNGNLAEAIKELKAGEGKPIVALGGAGFMQDLIATGLIDEYQLAIHPVTLGSGIPVFNGLNKPLYLKLAEVKGFPKGTVAHIYRV